MTAAPQVAPAVEETVYLTFSDLINQTSVNRIMSNLNIATQRGAKAVHLFFHSTGGDVSDGIALYNFLIAYPVDLTIYNPGRVASIAAIAYLGAKTRKASRHAVFMLHRSTNLPAQPMQGTALRVIAESAELDDNRSQAILATHAKIPADRMALLDKYDVFITAQDAVRYGIAQEIGEFAPPVGTKIYSA